MSSEQECVEGSGNRLCVRLFMSTCSRFLGLLFFRCANTGYYSLYPKNINKVNLLSATSSRISAR